MTSGKKTSAIGLGAALVVAGGAQGAASSGAGSEDVPQTQETSDAAVQIDESNLDVHGLDRILAYRAVLGVSTDREFVESINRDPDAYDAVMGSDTMGLYVTPEEQAQITSALAIATGREPILDYLASSGSGARALAFGDVLQVHDEAFSAEDVVGLARDYLAGDDESWRSVVPQKLDAAEVELSEAAKLSVAGIGDVTDETWAGTYVDWNTGGTLVVKFTKDHEAHLKALQEVFHLPGRIRTEQADYTLLELRITASLIAAEASFAETELGQPLLGIGVDVTNNRVRVGVVDMNSESVAAVEERYGAIVDVFQAEPGGTRLEVPMPPFPCIGNSPGSGPLGGFNCDPDRDQIRHVPRGGLSLRLGDDGLGDPVWGVYCTSGFLAENSGGTRRLLTAGHCGGVSDPMHQGFDASDPDAYRQIGSIGVRNYGGSSDVASISLLYTGSDDVYERPSVTGLDVDAWQSSVNADNVGDPTCLAGVRNPGDQDYAPCGWLSEINFTSTVTVPAPDSPWKAAFRCSTHLSDAGDSGSPIYNNVGGTVTAVGGHHGADANCDDFLFTGGPIITIPADAVYSHIKLMLDDVGLAAVATTP